MVIGAQIIGVMAVVLICEKCPNSLTIRPTGGKRDIKGTASEFGWTSTKRGWICPDHVQAISPVSEISGEEHDSLDPDRAEDCVFKRHYG